MNAQRMAEGAIAVIACSAGVAWMLAHLLARAVKAAARRTRAWLLRRLYPAVTHQRAVDAGLTPALASRIEPSPPGLTLYDGAVPWERPSEPDTPPPWWVTTDTPSPAEMYDHGIPLGRKE